MQTNEQTVDKLVNITGAMEARGASRSTVWRDVRKGIFPKPFYINSKSYWKMSQLIKWQNSLQTFDEHHAENIDPLTKKPREDNDAEVAA